MINPPLNRKLRMGLVGGGGAGFIGRVHAIAATLDQRAELVAGVLSSDPDRARAAATSFGIPPARAYGSIDELIAGEARLPPQQRIDFVSIATPNHTHYAIARAALETGLHVVCDKPLTTNLDDARHLVELVRQADRVLAVTHGYAGYPLVRQARAMMERGELGDLQAVRVHYIQGGLRRQPTATAPPRAAWKADPAKTGPGGTLADIGTHAFHLARFITQHVPREIACQLETFTEGRRLDDYGHVLLRFAGSAIGMLTFSQVTHGRMNDLRLEVDGTQASFTWRQENPSTLVWRCFGQPVQVWEQNPRAAMLDPGSREDCRLPGGHPEGFLEAFANIYRHAFDDMVLRQSGQPQPPHPSNYPNVLDGLEGVYFVERCLASHQRNMAWQPWDADYSR
jgi:predicted dehydrogenase